MAHTAKVFRILVSSTFDEARCPWCGDALRMPRVVPDPACPSCREPLRFIPFVVDNRGGG
jgi:hypothetical protein